MNEEMRSYVSQSIERSILKDEKRSERKGSFDFGCVEKQFIRRAKRSLRVMNL